MTRQNRPKRVLTLGALTGAATLGLAMIALPASADTEVEEPEEFTSAFTVMATPDEVVDEGEAAPGEPGATGQFNFRINSDLNIICYDITLEGVTGDYESPARTATHIHEAPAGESGPPRLAFPDPEPVEDGVPRTSSGCMEGPFTTGLEDDDGNDTGEGFWLTDIEANPENFNADSHTADYAPGVVRGQLQQVPVGGTETGGGGMETAGSVTPLVGAGVGAAALGAFGFFAYRRHQEGSASR